jgi:tetratricopeptide (TPR) repeat protein
MHSGATLALPLAIGNNAKQGTEQPLTLVSKETVELEQGLAQALEGLQAHAPGEQLAERLGIVGELLTGLADRHMRKGEGCRAEVLYLRAIQVFSAALPADHPLIALSRDNLAGLYKARRQYQLAESLQRTALADLKRHYQDQPHIDIALTMCNLGDTCLATGRVEDARKLIEEGLAMMIDLFGEDDVRVRELQAHYAASMRRIGWAVPSSR